MASPGSMHSQTYSKSVLLEKLKTNRELHATEHQETMTDYRKTVEKALRSRLAALEAGKDVDLKFTVPRPNVHLEEYDDAISMLENSNDTEIELARSEYQQYFLNRWQWQGDYQSTKSRLSAMNYSLGATADDSISY